MKQFLYGILALACLAGLTACGGKEEVPTSAASKGTAQEQCHIYTTQVQYTGEDDPVQYLEIAARSAHLLAELEDKAGAFVADFYNYQAMDDAGTPLYTMNGMQFAEEIDPNGHCIRVSRNYFAHNPIETADGSNLMEQFVYDDLTLNLLVPEKYQDMEEDIVAAHRERFYFEKVEAENSYNQEAGISDRINIAKEDLKINIIYVKDGQDYFSFRSDCAPQTGCHVEDPVVQIYTGNIHCNYAHSFMSQWVYIPSEAESAEEAYQEISDMIRSCGAEESVQKLVASAVANS
jgi:putative ABC transport system permease protein